MKPLLTIKSPCPKKWEELEEQGHDLSKFCTFCSKNVLDLTNKSETEIEEILARSKGSVCGKLRPKQISKSPSWNHNSLTNLSRQILSVLLFGVVALPNAKTFAQSKNNPQTIVSEINKPLAITMLKQDSLLVFSGRAIEKESQEPLPGVLIKIGNNEYHSTDKDGHFSFSINPSTVQAKSTLITFSFLGYESQEYKIPPESNTNWLVELSPEEMILGEIVVQRGIKYLPSKIWRTIKSVFRSKKACNI